VDKPIIGWRVMNPSRQKVMEGVSHFWVITGDNSVTGSIIVAVIAPKYGGRKKG
jgi:hypothetical protein